MRGRSYIGESATVASAAHVDSSGLSDRLQTAARAGAFVGRDAELASIAESLERAAPGRLRSRCSPASRGSETRLAAEAAARAEHVGARVLYGRSEEGLGVFYQPFAEMLDGLPARVGDRYVLVGAVRAQLTAASARAPLMLG